MTAPLHPRSTAFHPEAGGFRTGLWSRVLDFWLSGRMLFIGITGFLAGYLVMMNAEMQLLWLTLTCHPPLLAALVRYRGDGVLRDPFLRVAAVFILWNLTVGLVRNHSALSDPYTGDYLSGSVLLPLYLAGVWLVCRREDAPRTILRVLLVSGAIAAVTGLIYWRTVLAVETPGARLRNLLVHHGQHPVSTAMNFSFAIVAGVACYWAIRRRALRAVLLVVLAVMMLAVMLTLSRGALLALLCVPLAFGAALIISALHALLKGTPVREAVRPFSGPLLRSWPPLAVVALVGVWFLFYGGVLAPAPPPPPPGLPPAVDVIYLEKLSAVPMEEYLARETSGRTTFYRVGLDQMDRWDKHLTGAGLWGPELKLKEATAPILGSSGIDHFHSIFLATYIHAGVIGAG